MTTHKEALTLALEAYSKNERHRTLAETHYWCDQYKLLAQQAIKALSQPEQELVAYRLKDVEASTHYGKDIFVYFSTNEFSCHPDKDKLLGLLEPLYAYTTKPIEAKLKEKTA